MVTADMTPPESEATIAWRVGTLETDLRDERKARRDAYNKLDEDKADAKDVARLADEVSGLRRALLIFSLSMVGTAVTFLAVIFAVVSSQ
jgi:hypothetical protein